MKKPKVCFAWLYENEEEYQEYYEGWWSLKEVDEQVCLCLDIESFHFWRGRQHLNWTEQTITDFKELSLTFESIDDDGNIQFAVEETYNHGTLTPETPLVTRMELIGTIPNNGISYVDGSGNTRYFAVEVSGYDGSLLLTEFIP